MGNRGQGQKRNQDAEKRVFPVQHGRPLLLAYITYQRPYWLHIGSIGCEATEFLQNGASGLPVILTCTQNHFLIHAMRP